MRDLVKWSNTAIRKGTWLLLVAPERIPLPFDSPLP